MAWLARRYPAPRNGATSKGDRRILGDGAGRTTRWSVGLAASLLRLVTAGCRPGFGGSPNSGRGRDGNAGGTPTDSSRRYDPATDACTATRLVGAPAARPLDTAVWSGTQRIACGGFGRGAPRATPDTPPHAHYRQYRSLERHRRCTGGTGPSGVLRYEKRCWTSPAPSKRRKKEPRSAPMGAG